MAKAGMRRPSPKEPHGTESNHKTHPGPIPGSGRSAGEGIDYPLQYFSASLRA